MKLSGNNFNKKSETQTNKGLSKMMLVTNNSISKESKKKALNDVSKKNIPKSKNS